MPALEKDLPKIAVLGGGHGPRNIERALLKRTSALFSIVGGQQDCGGHTGKLSRELNIPGIGDLVSRMSNHFLDPYEQDTFDFRWEGELSFAGERPITNLLAADSIREGSISAGVKRFERRWVGYLGRTLPLTDLRIEQVISYANGDSKRGENHIDEQRITDPPITKISLIPVGCNGLRTNPEVLQTLAEANCKIIAPGTVWGSRDPIFHFPQIVEAMNQTQKPNIVIVNAFNLPETYGWLAQKHLQTLAKFGVRIDWAFLPIKPKFIPSQYQDAGYQFVHSDLDKCARFARELSYCLTLKESLDESGKQIIKHDGEDVANLVCKILRF